MKTKLKIIRLIRLKKKRSSFHSQQQDSLLTDRGRRNRFLFGRNDQKRFGSDDQRGIGEIQTFLPRKILQVSSKRIVELWGYRSCLLSAKRIDRLLQTSMRSKLLLCLVNCTNRSCICVLHSATIHVRGNLGKIVKEVLRII